MKIGRLTALLPLFLWFAACTPSVPDASPRRAVPLPPAADEEQAGATPSYNRLATPVRALARPSGPPPTVTASRVIVVDALSGRTLFSKNADQRCAVASTQKLLTALTVLSDGSLSDPVVVAASDTRVEPSKLYIKAGERYSRAALLKALLVKSGNDVAKALARDVGGSESRFMALMNARGRKLGMTSSNFTNPHGLTEPGQYSTARDIARCALVAYRQPRLRPYMGTTAYTFRHPDGRSKTLKNTNKLLRREPWVTGMKTGTTRASGRCLVSAGQHRGGHAIAVVLDSTSQSIWSDSENLLNWALGR